MEARASRGSAPIESAGVTYAWLLGRVSRIEARVAELPEESVDEAPSERPTVLEGGAVR